MSIPPRAIFFDLDETLIENRHSIASLFDETFKQFDTQLGEHKRDTFFSALGQHAKGLWDTMFEHDISPEKQFTNCFEQSIISTESVSKTDAAILANSMFEHFTHLSSNNVTLHHDSLSTLAELRQQGLVTGIITNGIEELQLGKIYKLGLQNRVDHIIVSAQARAHKPKQEVFDLALSKAKVDANQAWEIGDHATNDVAGAIRAGMQGVFYNPNQHEIAESFATLLERPSHVISNLSEVIKLVTQD